MGRLPLQPGQLQSPPNPIWEEARGRRKSAYFVHPPPQPLGLNLSKGGEGSLEVGTPGTCHILPQRPLHATHTHTQSQCLQAPDLPSLPLTESTTHPPPLPRTSANPIQSWKQLMGGGDSFLVGPGGGGGGSLLFLPGRGEAEPAYLGPKF